MKQFFQEEIKDTKGVIIIRKSKDRQHKRKRKKGQTTIHKTLHRKISSNTNPTKNRGYI